MYWQDRRLGLALFSNAVDSPTTAGSDTSRSRTSHPSRAASRRHRSRPFARRRLPSQSLPPAANWPARRHRAVEYDPVTFTNIQNNFELAASIALGLCLLLVLKYVIELLPYAWIEKQIKKVM
jgi:hypothetical protein